MDLKLNLKSHFKKLKVNFNNHLILEQALTHRSFLNEQKQIKKSNERLEYLGDAVLELITSEFLFHKFPNKPEGELTSLRAKIVQTKTLSYLAQELGLGRYLKLSKGEAISNGAQNPSILADTFEAVVGAIFLDQGLEKTRQFVQSYLLNNYKAIIGKSEVQDWKSNLQEVVQSQKGASPVYRIQKATGPDHDRQFTVAVSFFNQEQALGRGRSKQAAEQEAARNALEKLSKSE